MLELNGNDDELQRKLAALERAASDMRPAFEVIGRALITRIRLCFKLGVDPWGTAWAALKIRKGQPLVDTGRLRSSIALQISDTGLSIGTNLRSESGVSYPAAHQFGFSAHHGARSIMVRLRKVKNKNGKVVTRFAKDSHKKATTKWGTAEAWDVVVPARPFIPLRESGVDLPESWARDVDNALLRHLRKAAKE